jgi:hypothetical protein
MERDFTNLTAQKNRAIRTRLERIIYSPQDDMRRKKEIQKPIYWVSRDSVTEEVWDGVFDIYETEFLNGQKVEKPDYKDITGLSINGERLLEYRLTSSLNHVLEVRSLISGNELFLRFKAFANGSHYDEGVTEKKTREFERKVDDLLLSQKIAVPLSEIC